MRRCRSCTSSSERRRTGTSDTRDRPHPPMPRGAGHVGRRRGESRGSVVALLSLRPVTTAGNATGPRLPPGRRAWERCGSESRRASMCSPRYSSVRFTGCIAGSRGHLKIVLTVAPAFAGATGMMRERVASSFDVHPALKQHAIQCVQRRVPGTPETLHTPSPRRTPGPSGVARFCLRHRNNRKTPLGPGVRRGDGHDAKNPTAASPPSNEDTYCGGAAISRASR
ncbi:hypothetical protein HNQ52_001441 [Chiayiivirga flava]|uniref:Uncharacterized protein n=1 Tax=Chiayiivirga flava TaxID=659595 RepID=A0A7W8D5I0_9GAMM|nr:hypothetical protein [Chiayiivirga flava]